MLDSLISKKIQDFVAAQPRTIQEIAQLVRKNWRTADRYVQEIEQNYGTIASKTFRGGTRGALKIVYWSSAEKVSHSVFQQQLEEEILRARKKEDFSAFDLFQHVPEKNKSATVADRETLDELAGMLRNAQKQLLIFSGNLSFVNDWKFFHALEELVKKKIPIKILSRVDLVGRKNVEQVLSLNFKYGQELVEIRHREQPLRIFLMDNKVFKVKEVNEPTGKINELDKKLFLFYTIQDREWAEWLSKVFWKMFSSSIDAKVRLKEMARIAW